MGFLKDVCVTVRLYEQRRVVVTVRYTEWRTGLLKLRALTTVSGRCCFCVLVTWIIGSRPLEGWGIGTEGNGVGGVNGFTGNWPSCIGRPVMMLSDGDGDEGVEAAGGPKLIMVLTASFHKQNKISAKVSQIVCIRMYTQAFVRCNRSARLKFWIANSCKRSHFNMNMMRNLR